MDLRCGDAFELLKSIDDSSIDAIITDPPYGILKHKIETQIDIDLLFGEFYRVLRDNSFIVFFGRQPTLTEWNVAAYKRFNYKTEIIWYKKQRTSPFNDIGKVFENITVVVKGKGKINKVYRNYFEVIDSLLEFNEIKSLILTLNKIKKIFNDKRSYCDFMKIMSGDVNELYTKPTSKRNDTATISEDSKVKLKELSADFKKLKKMIIGCDPVNLIAFPPHNKISYNNDEYNVKHPTVKPVALMEYLVKLFSTEGQVVLDPFMGSGTTGIACKATGRDFMGFELDPGYFDISQKRISEAQVQTEMDLP